MCERGVAVDVFTELARSLPDVEHVLSVSEDGTEGDSSSFYSGQRAAGSKGWSSATTPLCSLSSA